MSWVTVLWSMIAAACLTLAGVHVLVWWRRRTARANLLFAVSAVATALLAAGELWMMRAGTPADFAAAVRWSHVPAGVLIVSLVGFVRLYLRAGRPWLAWTVVGLRALVLALNFLTGVNFNYREIVALRPVSFLGEPVTVAVTTPNPWMLVGQFSLLLFVVFVADAALTVWRRGDWRQALVVGGGTMFAALLGSVEATLVFWGELPLPIIISPFYLFIVVAMGLELSRELLRAAELSEESRRVQLEMARLRLEFAHAGRVTMLGQLASALAHELNQPLGAILRNAEAAELFLQRDPPDLDEIRAILADIRQDDQRAGAVIDRMHSLLQRRALETRKLDVAELIGEVAGLTRADAAARGTRIEVQVPPDGLPPVRGDRVHLQQVLLNLILNGLDALGGVVGERRRLTVRARRMDAKQSVEITVRDHGPGIPADQLAQVFEPFFTTKPDGLGMGLPISRTIIEAHGGQLWAENADDGGATFRFTLPTPDGSVGT